jgi:uncharacterized protein DUF3726
MIVSLNEIESRALKAARGAGMSWGLAEEAAAAASWLAERSLPWAETLIGLLAQQPHTCPPRIDEDAIAPSRAGARLCPILTGALLSDLGPSPHAMEVHDVLTPLWLAPFLARWTTPARAVRLAWGEAPLSIGPNTLSNSGAISMEVLAVPFASRVEIALAPATAAAHPLCERNRDGYPVPDDAWSALQLLEHRTYVPASAHSRLSGAGAGLLDND